MRLLGREERRRGELAALDERGVRLGVAVHEVRDELRVGELGGQDIVGGELGAAEDGLERAIATDETDGDLDRVLALVDDLDVMLVAGGGDDRGVDLKRGELAVADDGRGPKPVDTLRGVGNAAVSNRGDADSILAREVVLDLEGAVRRDVLNLPKQRLEVRVDELAVDDGEGNGALVGAVETMSGSQDTARFDTSVPNSHNNLDRKDQRSHANTVEAASKADKDEQRMEREAEEMKDPLEPARRHGNEPSRGAKIDKQIELEEEQMLKDKGKI